MMSKRFIISLLTIFTTAVFSQKMEFPAHWGEPPKIETMDLRVRLFLGMKLLVA